MQHVMSVELGNAAHPEYGVATIPFPIPDDAYEGCLKLLEPLEIGGVTAQDCKVERVDGVLPSLKALEGTSVNVDELDILAHILDIKIDDGADAKFEAMLYAMKITDICEMIDLALCCEQATVITDFSRLRETGIGHYLTINGGSAPVSEVEKQDGVKIMTDLIAHGNGIVTPYGVVYDNGMELTLKYTGGNFPVVGYNTTLVEVSLTPTVAPQEREGLYMLLPMPEKRLERMLLRAGFETAEDYTVSFEYMELPPEVNKILDGHEDELFEINRLCRLIESMDGPELERLAAAVLLTKPEYPSQVRHLAENLDLFEFIPNIKSPEELGRFMIQQSGHFEYDPNLEGFYDYVKYGEQRAREQAGEFNELGYVGYTGTLSFDELMMEEPAEQVRSEEQSQGQMMGGMM